MMREGKGGYRLSQQGKGEEKRESGEQSYTAARKKICTKKGTERELCYVVWGLSSRPYLVLGSEEEP